MTDVIPNNSVSYVMINAQLTSLYRFLGKDAFEDIAISSTNVGNGGPFLMHRSKKNAITCYYWQMLVIIIHKDCCVCHVSLMQTSVTLYIYMRCLPLLHLSCCDGWCNVWQWQVKEMLLLRSDTISFQSVRHTYTHTHTHTVNTPWPTVTARPVRTRSDSQADSPSPSSLPLLFTFLSPHFTLSQFYFKLINSFFFFYFQLSNWISHPRYLPQ